MTKLEQFKNEAENALPIAANANASKEAKASAFASLAWLALQILTGGNVKEEIELGKMVSKEGKYQALRQCVSNARPLANTLQEGNTITIENKREKTSATFNREDVLNAENPLFSVAVAYKGTRDKQEKVKEAFSDADAMALYAKAEGLTVSDIKKGTQGAQAEAIRQGHIMHAEQEKANFIASLADNVENMIGEFKTLHAYDPAKARHVLERLQAIAVNSVPELIDDMDEAQAA